MAEPRDAGPSRWSEEPFRFKALTPKGEQIATGVYVVPVEKGKADGAQPGEVETGAVIPIELAVPGLDGRGLRFVAERQSGGSWEICSSMVGIVKGGVARAELSLHHAGSGEAVPVRLRAELLPAAEARGPAPQTPPPSAPRVVVKPPPPGKEVKTGTLTVKGALAGSGFFIVDARTNKPVRADGHGPVKCDATSINGHYFVLKQDLTARFENIPAGRYRVVFTGEQTGEKGRPSPIRANAQGAHVVELKRYAQHGAVCETSVEAGKERAVNLTLGAQGAPRVCC